MILDISFRGSLKSCNYACDYCPMAMKKETAEQKKQDESSLNNFVDWIENNSTINFRILVTPWGEALVRRWYRDAMVRLSKFPNVRRVTIQTNLSRQPNWLNNADKSKLSLWVTYHPEQVALVKFMQNIALLDQQQVNYTVGMVGKAEYVAQIMELRERISSKRYFWINAFESGRVSYPNEIIEQFKKIDPLFELNYQQYPSYNKSCEAGQSSLMIDGEGNIKRCHFVADVLTHIDDKNWQDILFERSCPNQTCNCYIGYIHQKDLNMYQYYGENKLSRIPIQYATVD